MSLQDFSLPPRTYFSSLEHTMSRPEIKACSRFGQHPWEPFTTLIASPERFRTDAIQRCVREAFPDTKTIAVYRALDAIDELRVRPPALAIIGLALPDIDGLDVVDVINRERLISRVLVITDRRDEHSRAFLRQASIDGYFDSFAEETPSLTAAIRSVGEGGNYFSPSWHMPVSPCKPPLAALLTRTELRVLCVIGDGCDNEEAAKRLESRTHTIRTHRQHIMQKLGVQTRAELLREAQARGVVRMVEGRVLRPGFDQALIPPRRRMSRA